MKRWLFPALFCVLALSVVLSSRAGAAEQGSFEYDTGIRMTFGLGYGKQAVRDEAFGVFAQEVLSPAFPDGFTMLEGARGRWMHPQRGPIQERNVVVFLDLTASPELEETIARVCAAFVDRFPGSNASVYVVRYPGISASIFYQ